MKRRWPVSNARYKRLRSFATGTAFRSMTYGNTADGTLYYVMEYLQDDVAGVGQQKVVHCLQVALFTVRQICNALHEAMTWG